MLAVLGNAKRLEILRILLNQEIAVGPLAEKVSLSMSALSQHLGKLRELELVETRREHQMIYYSCRLTTVRKLMATVAAIFKI